METKTAAPVRKTICTAITTITNGETRLWRPLLFLEFLVLETRGFELVYDLKKRKICERFRPPGLQKIANYNEDKSRIAFGCRNYPKPT
jgi:hypothetical protein